MLNEMALRLEDNSEGLDEIVPFVIREIVDRFALRWYAERGIGALGELAPFISKQVLSDIAAREYEAARLKHFDELAPFLSRIYLTKLAKDTLEKLGVKAIAPVAPFLRRELLSEIVKEKGPLVPAGLFRYNRGKNTKKRQYNENDRAWQVGTYGTGGRRRVHADQGAFRPGGAGFPARLLRAGGQLL